MSISNCQQDEFENHWCSLSKVLLVTTKISRWYNSWKSFVRRVCMPKEKCLCLMLMKPMLIIENNLQTIFGSGSGVVVKLLACRARDPGSSRVLATMTSEIEYFLLPSFDMTETIMKQRKSLKQPKKQDSGSLIRHYYYMAVDFSQFKVNGKF